MPSDSFKAVWKQLTKLYKAVQDIPPPVKVTNFFLTIHNQFLQRIRVRLARARQQSDTRPRHDRAYIYRENLKCINVLPENTLMDAALAVIWN